MYAQAVFVGSRIEIRSSGVWKQRTRDLTAGEKDASVKLLVGWVRKVKWRKARADIWQASGSSESRGKSSTATSADKCGQERDDGGDAKESVLNKGKRGKRGRRSAYLIGIGGRERFVDLSVGRGPVPVL